MFVCQGFGTLTDYLCCLSFSLCLSTHNNHIFKVTLCNNSIIFVALKNLFSYKICCCAKLQEIFGHLKAKLYFFFFLCVRYGGYTSQDNRADFGPISPLPTILGNVPIILVDLKIIWSDFSVVWGVLRVTESARKNVRGAPMANCKHFTYSDYIWNPAVWGGGHTEDKRTFDLQIITWN